MFVADDVTLRFLSGGDVAMKKKILASAIFATQGQGGVELAEALVVVADKEDEFSFSRKLREVAKLLDQSRDRQRAMHNVAEQDEPLRPEFREHDAQASERIVRRRNRHELARGAMAPCVTEMQIRRRQQLVLREISDAARVKNDIGKRLLKDRFAFHAGAGR